MKHNKLIAGLCAGALALSMMTSATNVLSASAAHIKYYNLGFNIQVGSCKNAKITVKVKSTKNNIYDWDSKTATNEGYMYTVQKSWNGDAQNDDYVGTVYGSKELQWHKGAGYLIDWDTGSTKYNGTWAQITLTDEDISSLTFEVTFDGTDSRWEYHQFNDEEPLEDQYYETLIFAGGIKGEGKNIARYYGDDTYSRGVSLDYINAQIGDNAWEYDYYNASYKTKYIYSGDELVAANNQKIEDVGYALSEFFYEDIHDFTKEIITQPTCTTPGECIYTCSCGYSFKEKMSAKGHHLVVTVVEPTITKEGYTQHTCSECGYNYRDNFTNYYDRDTSRVDDTTSSSSDYYHTHSYTSKITKQPTCTAAGTRTYTCSCGDSYTESIPATGHTWVKDKKVAATTTSQGYTVYKCCECGNIEKRDYTEKILPGTNGLEYSLNESGSYTLAGYSGNAKTIVIPSEYNGKPVTCIGKCAFEDCTSITSISIPSSVTSIKWLAFSGCTNLESIKIPNSVMYIYGSAFWDCKSLKSITIPDSITSIEPGLFGCCESLESITIPNSVSIIGESAFQNCTSLTSVTIPNSVTIIGDSAFLYCTNLTSITIPNSVTSIEQCAFGSCSSLKNVTIPNSVTNIERCTFAMCKNLASITIPNSVTNIDKEAFLYCDMSKLVIYCNQNSTAEKFAKENGIKYKYVSNHVHSYTSKVTKEPTCTATGTRTYTCSCGDSYTESIPATGHKWVKEKTVAATTTSQGYTVYKCSKCGKTENRDYTPKLSAKTDISTAPAKLNATKIAYTGKAKTPGVNITIGGKKLVKGTDFTVTYSNNVKPGKAIATVKGIGNYKGSQTLTFYIVPKKTKLNSLTSKAKTKLTANWKKDTLADGYQVQVSTVRSFKPLKKSMVIKSNSTVNKTISGLKSGTTYFVRVRAYKTVGNTRRFGAYSTVKTVIVK